MSATTQTGPANHQAGRALVSHSPAATVALHLLPGVITFVFFIFLKPWILRRGWPTDLATPLSLALGFIPFALVYLLYQSRKATGRRTLLGAIPYKEKMPVWQYFVFVPVLILWAVASSFLLSEATESYIIKHFFSWVPGWFFQETKDLSRFSSPVLMVTFVLNLLTVGLIAPILEEFYFRGIMLARLARLGVLAPILNTLLFTLYHLDVPWTYVYVFVGSLPLAFAIWWKKNVWIGVWGHVIGNLLYILLSMVPVLVARFA